MSVRSMYSSSINQYFVIDKNTRIITPPTSFKNFGVESDENSNRVYFECPRFVGDHLDLSKLNVRINYKNANGIKDQYIVDDVTIDGENVHFSWVLGRNATVCQGTVSFIVCAVKTDAQGVIKNEWNTTLATGTVLHGLEIELQGVPENVTDIVNQLLNIVSDAKNDMEVATSDGLTDIKTAESQAIDAVKNTPNSMFMNAVKGNVSGEIVTMSDVSPVEHTVNVNVRSKNLCRLTGSGEKNGLTYFYENGVWNIQGTPTIGYAGIESMVITNQLEDGKTYTISQSQYFESSANAGAVYLQVLIEDYDGNQNFVLSVVNPRSFVVDKTKYKRYVLTLQCGTAMQKVSVSNFTVQLEEGNTATEYTPYVAPSNVTVSSYKKNLFNGIWDIGNIVSDGIDGTSTDRKRTSYIMVQPSTNYFYSTNDGYTNLNIFEYDSNKVFLRGQNTKLGDILTSEDTHYIRIYNELTDYENSWYQIEEGTVDSSYEPYCGAEYVPSTEGIVHVTSISPNMTLHTDTKGVIVDCEYNKDSNIVIQQLIDRITILENQGS